MSISNLFLLQIVDLLVNLIDLINLDQWKHFKNYQKHPLKMSIAYLFLMEF